MNYVSVSLVKLKQPPFDSVPGYLRQWLHVPGHGYSSSSIRGFDGDQYFNKARVHPVGFATYRPVHARPATNSNAGRLNTPKPSQISLATGASSVSDEKKKKNKNWEAKVEVW